MSEQQQETQITEAQMVAIRRQFAAQGGRARMQKLTTAERRAMAKAAGNARWHKQQAASSNQ